MDILILVGLGAAVWLLFGLSDHTRRTIHEAGDAMDAGTQSPAGAMGSMAWALIVFALGALLVLALLVGAGAALHGG
jgi:hypothetical protein